MQLFLPAIFTLATISLSTKYFFSIKIKMKGAQVISFGYINSDGNVSKKESATVISTAHNRFVQLLYLTIEIYPIIIVLYSMYVMVQSLK